MFKLPMIDWNFKFDHHIQRRWIYFLEAAVFSKIIVIVTIRHPWRKVDFVSNCTLKNRNVPDSCIIGLLLTDSHTCRFVAAPNYRESKSACRSHPIQALHLSNDRSIELGQSPLIQQAEPVIGRPVELQRRQINLCWLNESSVESVLPQFTKRVDPSTASKNWRCSDSLIGIWKEIRFSPEMPGVLHIHILYASQFISALITLILNY